MREILFKAKRSDNGKWIHGDLKTIGECSITTGDGIYNEDVDPETVCQFTGRVDCDDNKIFENDKIRYIDGQLDREYIVKYHVAGFEVFTEKGSVVTGRLEHENEYMIITGNIHDRRPALSA